MTHKTTTNSTRKAIKKRRPSLLPLARDPSYVPSPPEEIRKALSVWCNDMPELDLLKTRDLWAIEMILDYISKDMRPRLAYVAQRAKMDSRTLNRKLMHDRNFCRVLERAINRGLKKSPLLLTFARFCHMSERQNDFRRIEIMYKIFGQMHYNDFRQDAQDTQDSQKTLISEVDQETGMIRIAHEEAAP